MSLLLSVLGVLLHLDLLDVKAHLLYEGRDIRNKRLTHLVNELLRHLLLHGDVHGGQLPVFEDLLGIVQNDNVVQVLVRAGADATIVEFRVEDVLSVASGRLAI
jgi:hypothetical protein